MTKIPDKILTHMIKHYGRVPCDCGTCSGEVDSWTSVRRAREVMEIITGVCPRCNAA